ncbi:hypothetical protein [Chryseolinea serpens]|uniref:hypothetical protein n=1 Tax=Chryseolinea serpens TaxID=947013 RepID=UPI000933906B|nr:hypothetical protein [Chryseolinea serpens]
MKKLIAFVAVCGFALAFAACGKKAETAESNVDSAAVEAAAPAVDSAAAAADTTKADTTKAQ